MAEDKTPFERPAHSALADGAARFDNLAKELKSRQIADHQGGRVSTDYAHAVVSPDEVWSRNFMTQGIGPKLDVQPISSVMPARAMPGVAFDLSPPPAPPRVMAEVRSEPPAGPIGSALGRPPPRRSWLSRMLKPRSRGDE